MTSTELVCSVDQLGRVKIPTTVADLLNWQEKNTICITLKNDSILLTKADAVCMFCGSTDEVANLLGKSICKTCAATIDSEQPITDTVISGHKRKLDELRRIVLPIEFRNLLDIGENDSVELFIEEHTLVVRKYGSSCIFCKTTAGLHRYKGRDICERCSKQVRAIFQEAPQILASGQEGEEELSVLPEEQLKAMLKERSVTVDDAKAMVEAVKSFKPSKN